MRTFPAHLLTVLWLLKRSPDLIAPSNATPEAVVVQSNKINHALDVRGRKLLVPPPHAHDVDSHFRGAFFANYLQGNRDIEGQKFSESRFADKLL
jgi:hypothetical protein